MELEDCASEKLSGRVQLEDHLPKWRALRNFSFQPCIYVAVNFCLQLNFILPLFLGMVMYDNEFKTKEK